MVEEGEPKRLSPLPPTDDEEVVEGWGEVDAAEGGEVLMEVTVVPPVRPTWVKGEGEVVLTATRVAEGPPPKDDVDNRCLVGVVLG